MNKVLKIFFLIINSLFIAKYANRLGFNPVLAVVVYCLIASIIILLISKNNPSEHRKYKIPYLLLSITLICAILFLQSHINPLKLQVDRWSAIQNFIQNLFNGTYPYAARTHLGGYGSPFPVWQAFHIPFYLLGNVGLGMLFSTILLSVFLVWLFDNYHQALYYIVLLFISPAFWYEAAVRSDLSYNFILCFMAIAAVHKKQLTIQHHAIGLGVLWGLFLSTRLSVLIPFSVFLFPDFLTANLRQKIVFVASTLITFLITFLPFLFWNFKALLFFEYSPVLLQARQGAPLEIIVLLALVLFFSLRWKNDFRLYASYITVIFIVFISITFLHRMINDGFENNLFSSYYDITYFNMSLPFMLFAIIGKNVSLTHVSKDLHLHSKP
jgi:hypothetical protein